MPLKGHEKRGGEVGEAPLYAALFKMRGMWGSGFRQGGNKGAHLIELHLLVHVEQHHQSSCGCANDGQARCQTVKALHKGANNCQEGGGEGRRDVSVSVRAVTHPLPFLLTQCPHKQYGAQSTYNQGPRQS